MTDEDLIADEDVVVTISGRGYIKRQPVATYRRQHRGGKGIIGHVTREEDAVEHLLVANTHDWALFFTNRGRVFSAKVHAIPDASRQAKGMADHQPAGRPGGVGRGPDGHDHPARTSSPATYLVHGHPQGHHQEDPARAVRAGPLDGHPGHHDRTTTTSSRGSTSRPAHDDVIIATAQGMLARFDEDEVRADGPRRRRRHRHPPRSSARATRSSG